MNDNSFNRDCIWIFVYIINWIIYSIFNVFQLFFTPALVNSILYDMLILIYQEYVQSNWCPIAYFVINIIFLLYHLCISLISFKIILFDIIISIMFYFFIIHVLFYSISLVDLFYALFWIFRIFFNFLCGTFYFFLIFPKFSLLWVRLINLFWTSFGVGILPFS